MKTAKRFALTILIALLPLAGCKKQATSLPPTQANGATVDMAALNQALSTSSSADVRSAFADFYTRLRYGDYPGASANLDKIAADPSLTDAQKKVVSDAQAAVKQMAAAAKPAP